MSKPKILIIGSARHGKDFMAETLRDNFDFSFKSSSMAAAEIFIYDKLKNKYGYKSFEECFNDRVNRRAEWYDLIVEYNTPDKLRLAKHVLMTNDCYVGMRNFDEIEKSKELFDLVVWVDASGRLPVESKKSMTGVKWQSDIIIDNNGSQTDFKNRVIKLGNLLYKK